MLLHKMYINVAIANILVYSFTLSNLLERKYKNLKCGFREKWFLANISLSVHFSSYVAHKLYVNVTIPSIFPSHTCSLGPSQAKLLAIYGKKREKTVIFSPKPKRIWLYCRDSVAFLSSKELI